MFKSYDIDYSRYDPPGNSYEWDQVDEEMERVRDHIFSNLTDLEKAALSEDREKFKELLTWENDYANGI